MRVGRPRQRRLLAPLGAADRSRLRLPHPYVRRPRAIPCPDMKFWIRARALPLTRTYRDTQFSTMSIKKKPCPKVKKKMCNVTAALDHIRGQELATVGIHVRGQVVTEWLVFFEVVILAPDIEDSNHAARGRLLHSGQCGGRVSSTDSVGQAGGAAAARRRSPGCGSATMVRPTIDTIVTPLGGSSRAGRTLTINTRTPPPRLFPVFICGGSKTRLDGAPRTCCAKFRPPCTW